MTAPRVIVIVGCGALGSHVALFLRNERNILLRLVDFDRVEAKNCASQFHTKMGLGKNKAKALEQSLMGLYGLKIEAVPYELCIQNASALFDKATLVLDCVDNARTRRIIQDYCKEHEVPCLHGALAANGEFGQAIWDLPASLFRIDSEDVVGQATCAGGEFLPFIVEAAARMAAAVQVFLKTGKKVGFQLTGMSLHVV